METHAAPGAAYQLILFACFLIPAILFLLTQQNTLRAIGNGNRLMDPWLVWLQLIPFFGQVWQFFVVARIAGSIRNEMGSWDKDPIFGADAQIAEHGGLRPTLGIGIAYCTLNVLIILLNFLPGTNTLYLIVGLTALTETICWIVYWVRIASDKNKLRQKNLATL